MRLVGTVSQAGGQVNEDAWGIVGRADDVAAAWVLDGVTGINGRNDCREKLTLNGLSDVLIDTFKA